MIDEKTLFASLYIRQMYERAKRYHIRPISEAGVPDGNLPVWYDDKNRTDREVETIYRDGPIRCVTDYYPVIFDTAIGSEGDLTVGSYVSGADFGVMHSPVVKIRTETPLHKEAGENAWVSNPSIEWEFDDFVMTIFSDGDTDLRKKRK